MAADEHDSGRQHGADDAGRPGSGSGRCRGHPAATCRERFGADRQSVLAELGGVSPETILRRQEGAAPVFVVNVVEVVCRFDHGSRLFQTVPPWGVAPLVRALPAPTRRLPWPVCWPLPEGDNWLELTSEPLPTERALGMGGEAVVRSGGVFRRDGARPRRGADRGEGHRLRGLYLAGAAALSRRSPPPPGSAGPSSGASSSGTESATSASARPRSSWSSRPRTGRRPSTPAGT